MITNMNEFEASLPCTKEEIQELADAAFRIYQAIGYDLPGEITMIDAVEVCLDAGRLEDMAFHGIENGAELQERYSSLYQLIDNSDDLHQLLARRGFF